MPSFLTASCKSRILGQESISRMNGVCVVRFRHFDDFFYIQITLFRCGRTYTISFVCVEHMLCSPVCLENIAILVISISRQERITLTAISPRLATKIFLSYFSKLSTYLFCVFPPCTDIVHLMKTQYFLDLGLNK